MKKRITAFTLCIVTVLNILMMTGCFVTGDGEVGTNPDNDIEKEPLVISGITDPEKYADFNLSKDKLEQALVFALEKIDSQMIPQFTDKFPSHNSTNNVYKAEGNTGGWNCGFWTGILWHAYELTGDDKYMEVALGQIPSYVERINNKVNVDHHDMGFLYIPSCVAAYKLTGDTKARAAAIKAADQLISRYHEKGQFIQAWGSMGNKDNYRLIVDCLMNIPLLYWASEETGNSKYSAIANKHFQTTMDVCYRSDGSTYHTYYFDPVTGAPLKGVTAQGASDDSTWARGQAWGMYGPMLNFIYQPNAYTLTTFKASANYFLNYLPEDYVPYWDLSFSDGSSEPRDSSSAAIAVCAMLEAVKYMPETEPLRDVYMNACKRIMNSLIDSYTTRYTPEANGLLLHGTYNKNSNTGVDEMTIWGDYFYMEALHRMLDPDWDLYW